jgi:hypothetical protein
VGWTGIIWLRIRTSGNKVSVFHKMLGRYSNFTYFMETEDSLSCSQKLVSVLIQMNPEDPFAIFHCDPF